MTINFKKIISIAIFFVWILLSPTFLLAEDEPINFDGPTLLPKATLYMTSPTEDIVVNSNFTVPVYVNTQGNSINTIRIDLNFNPSDVAIVGSSGVDSILGILFESPVYDNQNGLVSVTGIIPNGVSTSSGLITTLTFKALAVGETTISISDYSSANLNDGIGSEVILALDEETYNIVEGEQTNICITNPSDPSCTVVAYCELHPTDPVCVNLTFCQQNPTDPSCSPTQPTWCQLHPADPVCTATSFCQLYPTNPVCVAPNFCDEHPDDPACVGAGTFCSLNPTDPSCSNTEPGPDTNTEIDDTETTQELIKVVNNFTDKTLEVKDEVSQILETPAGDVTSKVITATGAMTGAFISIASGMFASPISFGELFLIPFRIWSLILTAFGLKKRKTPWGTVYDSVTKQPLDPAYVVLKDLEGNEVATSITDLDGRYGFLVAPGEYRMVASKTNYEFPSKKLAGKERDELYDDLYFDGVISIKEGGVITKNIPMDPLKFDWNEFAKRDKKLMKFFRKRDIWISRISEVLFFFGFIIAVVATIAKPALYNFIILLIYLFMYISKKTILKPRPYGYVRQKIDKNPLSFAIVRAFFAGSDHEVIHKVADKTGKYYCLIPNGKYEVKIENKNPDGSYLKLDHTHPIEVKNGCINEKFEI